MITLQQLQSFVVSADLGSFSEAAAVLYTTQSNVSRMISALEKEVGSKLFIRDPHGIHLSERGKQLYVHASKVLTDMESFTDAAGASSDQLLAIASNPGSWFARTFVSFYLAHQKAHWHYLVHTCTSEEVLKRTGNGLAEIGFLYLFRDEWNAFQYRMKRDGLQFTALKEVKGMLYSSSKKDADKLPYVQMEQDAFTSQKHWMTEQGTVLPEMETAVITNSDYIMRMLLDQADIANISAQSFYQQEGTILDNGKGNAVYGYVQKKDAPLSEMAEAFLQHVTKKLN